MATQFSFEAIGTHWTIDIYEDLSDTQKSNTLHTIHDRIAIFDKNYSRFRDDSWVMKMSHETGTYDLPSDAKPMLSLYQDLYKITNGLMTPLIGQVLVDAGYDKNYSLVQKQELTKPLSWDEAIDYHPPLITIKKPALLDFGACGKGYLVDIVGSVLEDCGIKSYCVDAGGDILHKSYKEDTLRIGLEDPDNLKQVIGTLRLHNKSIAGSSGNRRRWKSFNHIINPHTLTSPETISAVWVVAGTTILADAMTTALYFTKPERLLEKFDFDYLILYQDRSVEGTLLNSSMLELFA